MLIADLLRRENNNFDLLRLIAAAAVIWGHAYALVLPTGRMEPIGRLLGFDYSGSLAVEFFFFLSGILITHSLMVKQSVAEYAIHRVMRIFPALIVSCVVCVLVIGPLFSDLGPRGYFGQAGALKAVLLHPYIEYGLPGVFQHNLYPQTNGAIWTIKYELFMYAMLAVAGLCGLLKYRRAMSLVCLVVACTLMLWPGYISLTGLSNVNLGGRLPAFFLFGSLLALHKGWARIDGRLVAGLVLLAVFMRHGTAFQFVFYAAFLTGCLWVASTRLARAIRLPGDFSYGVYVWGWPVQQIFAACLPHMDRHLNQILSFAVALGLAMLSWYFIEKPSISFGKRASTWLAWCRSWHPLETPR
ncbi:MULTISPECIES: acyltransferase [unclassified Acidocella]|uniref:acyltransferase family protein n=1 Tax=unclassified Acidocella TaxID=2648610 RepID=UPI00028DB018|nr:MULTISPECIES: acyltransferase [unclassified Acidocella]EKM99604.1 acyltransferase 3 [Acidocella sp. MX-AZ02]WBO58253.1 acyltransferase [Acidocella sp. MX-AZ03]